MTERELAWRLGLPVSTITTWVRTGEVKVRTQAGGRYSEAEVAEIFALAELRQVPCIYRRSRPLLQALREHLAAGHPASRLILVVAGNQTACCASKAEVARELEFWVRRTGPFFMLPIGEMMAARGMILGERTAEHV